MSKREKGAAPLDDESRFTLGGLSGPNLIIIADFIGANPGSKLFVVDARKVREEGADLAGCTYELVLNGSRPPEVCYRVVEEGIPKVRLLSDPEKKFNASNTFQLTDDSYESLEAFRVKNEDEIAKRQKLLQHGTRERTNSVVDVDPNKEAVVKELLGQYATRKKTYEKLGHDVSTMPTEDKIRSGILKLPDAVFEAIRTKVIPNPCLALVAPGGRKSKIKAIDAYQEKQELPGVVLEKIDNDELLRRDSNSTEWTVGITDGTPVLTRDLVEVHTAPDLTYYDQVKAYVEKWKKHGFGLMEGADPCLAFEEIALVEGGNMSGAGNHFNFMALNGQKLIADELHDYSLMVYSVCSPEGRLYFKMRNANLRHDQVRCRPWVWVDVS